MITSDLFCIQGPDILSEIRHSHGQSSVPDGCRHFHGIPRAVGHSISSSWMQTQVVEMLRRWYPGNHQEAQCRWTDSTSEFRCPSSTPSLCGRPMDVWRYWYTERRHTDQYLHFSSHHPLQHKLSVVRTLLDRSSQIVTEEEDREREEHHIRTHGFDTVRLPWLEHQYGEKPDANTEDKEDHPETNPTALRWTQVHSGYSVCANFYRPLFCCFVTVR